MATIKQVDPFVLLEMAGYQTMVDQLKATLDAHPELLVDYNPPTSSTGVTDPRDFGAKCNGVTDDTQAVKDAVASMSTHPAVMEGGRLFLPGPMKVSDTIEFRKFSGEVYGNGGLKSGGGFNWDGPADIPVVRVRECHFAYLHDFRVTGHSGNPPSAAVEMHNNQTEDAWANSFNMLERLWLGAWYKNNDARMVHGVEFTGGGVNSNNDKNHIKDCRITKGTGAAVKLGESQNVLNRIEGGSFSDMAQGIDAYASFTADNLLCTRMSDVDVVLRNGQSAVINYWHSEKARSFLRLEAGGRVKVTGGTWQTTPGYCDGTIIEDNGIQSSTIILENQLWAVSRWTDPALPPLMVRMRPETGERPKTLLMNGVRIDYGPVALNESNFDVGLNEPGFRHVEGSLFGQPNAFRNILQLPSDQLDFNRFDGSS